MRKLYLKIGLTVFLLWCAAAQAAENNGHAAEISGQVLLPTGKPAVGAKITARHINPVKRSVTWEVTTETDAQGVFDTTVPYIIYTAASGRWNRPYLLVDMSKCAVCFIPLGDVEKRVDEQHPVIQLEKDAPFQGTVVDDKGKPVSGAEVIISSWNWSIMEGSLLNLQDKVNTPALSAKSGSDGKFSLRGISVPQYMKSEWLPCGLVYAVAIIGGYLWAGEASLRSHPIPNSRSKDKPLVVTLGKKSKPAQKAGLSSSSPKT